VSSMRSQTWTQAPRTGFIQQQIEDVKYCDVNTHPACGLTPLKNHATEPYVMGYHRAAEIPNSWTYANELVLTDHLSSPSSCRRCPTTCIRCGQSKYSVIGNTLERLTRGLRCDRCP
jgi:hypothetical protein